MIAACSRGCSTKSLLLRHKALLVQRRGSAVQGITSSSAPSALRARTLVTSSASSSTTASATMASTISKQGQAALAGDYKPIAQVSSLVLQCWC